MDIAYLVLVNDDHLFDGLVDNLRSHGVNESAIHARRGATSITTGYNRAASEAPPATLLCLIHQDARLLFDVETTIPRFFTDHPSAGVVGFVGSTEITPGGAWWLGGRAVGKLIQGSSPQPFGAVVDAAAVDVVDGYCMFIRRDVFDRIGGFDERFDDWHFYDSDLCMAARRGGFQNYVLDAWTQHLSAGSTGPAWMNQQRKFREKWYCP